MQQEHPESFQQSQLLGVQEAARYLDLSERQLRQMIKEGAIPSVRIGKRLSISVAQLEAFVKAHQQ